MRERSSVVVWAIASLTAFVSAFLRAWPSAFFARVKAAFFFAKHLVSEQTWISFCSPALLSKA
ncbi:hypothetical protein ES703_124607 [subsurface metagenome]